MQSTTVSDLMTESPRTVTAEDTLVAVYDVMADLNCRHVPVVDGDGGLIGMVSERDLLRRAIGTDDLPISNFRAYLNSLSVEAAMTTGIETAYGDDPIDQAAQKMLDNKFGCLPVLEGERVIGVLTESDFVRQVALESGV